MGDFFLTFYKCRFSSGVTRISDRMGQVDGRLNSWGGGGVGSAKTYLHKVHIADKFWKTQGEGVGVTWGKISIWFGNAHCPPSPPHPLGASTFAVTNLPFLQIPFQFSYTMNLCLFFSFLGQGDEETGEHFPVSCLQSFLRNVVWFAHHKSLRVKLMIKNSNVKLC